MNCDQARHLFDAYLDGELCSTLATEFAAHRLDCEDCRRRLALMEVVEHVIHTDEQPSEGLCDGFTDRLMACLPQRPARRSRLRDPRWLYLGAPLATAAAVAFLMYGPYSTNGQMRVKGRIEQGEPQPQEQAEIPDAQDVQDAWQQWLREFDRRMTRSGEATLADVESAQPDADVESVEPSSAVQPQPPTPETQQDQPAPPDGDSGA